MRGVRGMALDGGSMTSSHTDLLALRARIEAMDCYTAPGARDAGLHFADISTEHVKAFRDRILDMIDEAITDDPKVQP